MEVSYLELKKLLDSGKLCFIDFWASWCIPCKTSEEIIKELNKEIGDKIIIKKINVDKNPSAPDNFNIKGVPTFIIFNNGKEVERHVGSKSKQQLNEIIQKYL